MHLWPDRVVNQLNLDTRAIITNSRMIKNIDSIEFTTCEIPVVALGIAGLENNMYALREWSWCMNQTALDTIVKYDPVDMVHVAKNIRKEAQTNTVHCTLQSPSIWGKIFENTNMIIQNTSQFNTKLLRYLDNKKKYIDFYGDIS
jgi:hypothetical protein